MEDVLGYLQSKNLHLKKASGKEVNIPCFYCNEPEGKRGRLYINVDPDAEMPGLHTCFLCGQKGNIYTLRRHFGDPVRDEEVVTEHRWEIYGHAADFYHQALAEHQKPRLYLKEERGFSIETISERKLGYGIFGLNRHLRGLGFSQAEIEATGLVHPEKGSGNLIETLQGRITIPYMSAGTVAAIRGRAFDDLNGAKYKTPPGTLARLFNSDATWEAEEVVITEGEFNAIALAQQGIAAVGVPGANTWQQGWEDYFTETKRVHLCLDTDDAGAAGARKIKDALGAKARVVTMPVGVDANDFFLEGKTAEDFHALVAKTQPNILLTVDDAYVDFLEFQTARGLQLGIEDIDNRIFPGLLPAQVMVILARTGVGKTITLLNTFQRIRMIHPEAKILFLSLEQTRGEWFERARRIGAFYDYENMPTEHTVPAIEDYLAKTSERTLAEWRQRLLMVDRNRLSEEQMKECLEEYALRMGKLPDVVAVDYLGYWAQSFPGEAYSRLTSAVMALKAVAKEYKVPIIAPHQVNRSAGAGADFDEDAARDAGTIGETADFIFGIRNPDHLVTQDNKNDEAPLPKNEVIMKILKSRHGGKGTSASLQWAPLSLTLVTSSPTLKGFAQDERIYENQNDRWYTAHYRHRTGTRHGHIDRLELDD